MRYLKRFNESNIESDFYRGVGLDEAIKACQAGHLIYLSKEPMSRDWEVIEYSMGDRASDATDEEIEEFVDSIVPWENNGKGVNLTTDLENAKGYSPIVLGVNVIGDYAEFSHAHIFARYPEECIVKSVFYKGKQMTPLQFLRDVQTDTIFESSEFGVNPSINWECIQTAKDIALEYMDEYPVELIWSAAYISDKEEMYKGNIAKYAICDGSFSSRNNADEMNWYENNFDIDGVINESQIEYEFYFSSILVRFTVYGQNGKKSKEILDEINKELHDKIKQFYPDINLRP